MKIEKVAWLDAETRDSWREHAAAVQAATADSMEAWAIGAVVAETDDRVVLAAMGNSASYASLIGIPKSSIVSRKVLK